MSKIELAPCPFCWGEANFTFDGYHVTYCIGCDKCGARSGTFNATDEAIAAWNRRATPPAPAGWVMAPKEPTPEMMAAGLEPLFTENVKDSSENGRCGRIYRAMISAAGGPQ